jgi:N-acetyl-alpha-D-muramate 1-phosphate uridylyltransferase
MILAAGRGERMRPLTDTTPKPLLQVRGKALIEWHIQRLKACGFDEIIINIAHLGEQIRKYLGDGSRYGVDILYSDERQSGALESAGAIIKALPLLGKEPFLVVNGDIFCDYTFDPHFELHDKLAHLVLVSNPQHNQKGDFGIKNKALINQGDVQYTFSGIGYYSPRLFENLALQKMPLAPLLRQGADEGRVSAQLYDGMWHDIGTPERLERVNRR